MSRRPILLYGVYDFTLNIIEQEDTSLERVANRAHGARRYAQFFTLNFSAR